MEVCGRRRAPFRLLVLCAAVFILLVPRWLLRTRPLRRSSVRRSAPRSTDKDGFDDSTTSAQGAGAAHNAAFRLLRGFVYDLMTLVDSTLRRLSRRDSLQSPSPGGGIRRRWTLEHRPRRRPASLQTRYRSRRKRIPTRASS